MPLYIPDLNKPILLAVFAALLYFSSVALSIFEFLYLGCLEIFYDDISIRLLL